MLYQKVDCPHCGNEITVSNLKETQKCQWCRRLVSVKLERKGKKIKCDVEAIDFAEKTVKKTNYSRRKGEYTHGHKQN